MGINLQKLLFEVNLLDKTRGPAQAIIKTMDSVNNRVSSGYKKLGTGLAGTIGAFYSFDRIVSPAKEMEAALGTVKSLDVANDVLLKLEKSALKTSIQFGDSAASFVSASYDIQSAIAGLVGDELPAFTRASAILAKGTKSDTATITNFVGTMYGIFQKNADQMGKADWVNMLAGQTATAVQMFKTTGQEMSSAFGQLGAEATAHGIIMNEQIAVLGTLQSTMTGSEAATKYKSFLAGVGKAQKVLGLEFIDSQGKMLPIVSILERIKGKYGAIDTVAESDLLQKAFGRKEAVGLIKLLSTNVDGLSHSITQVGKAKGIDKAMEMAKAMTKPWDQAGAAISAVQTKFGSVLLGALTPVFNLVTNTGQAMVRWMGLFPNLTKVIGVGVVAVLGLVAALSMLTVASGLWSMASAGWLLSGLLLKGMFFTLKAAIFTALPAIWSFTVALLANPITWIVLGIGTLASLLVASVVYWDEWTGAVMRLVTGWWEAINAFTGLNKVLGNWGQWWSAAKSHLFTFINIGATVIKWWWKLIGVFALTNIATAAWEILPQWWTSFKEWLSGFWGNTLNAIFDASSVMKIWEVLPLWWQSFSSWLSGLDLFSGISSSLDWLLQKINLIPGVDISFNEPPSLPDAPKAIASSGSTSEVPAGGLFKQISNMTNNNRSTNVGGVTVNNFGKPMNGFELQDELELAAG